METMLSMALIQSCAPDGVWGTGCVFWEWASWIGFIVGLVGMIIGLFMKSNPSK